MQTRSSPAVHTLHRLAKQAAIADYETLSKSMLFTKLKEQFNIDRLQRAEKRHTIKKRVFSETSPEEPGKESTSNVIKPKKVVRLNKLDPIMFTPLKKHTFNFYRPNGSYVAFNVDSLVDYILSTGDFSDPETRIPFKDSDLEEIDRIVGKAGLDRPSVLKSKHDPQAFSELKFRRDALVGLERCAGEVVTDMLNIIETCDPDEAQMRLLLREFPAFADLYQQISEAEPEYAKHCMAHWKLFLRGPPNSPNDDYYGLIDISIHFMNSLIGYRRNGGEQVGLSMAAVAMGVGIGGGFLSQLFGNNNNAAGLAHANNHAASAGGGNDANISGGTSSSSSDDIDVTPI